MADATVGGEMLRVRFDLELSVPPIWRTLDLASSMSLDRVHDVVQAAFGWDDAHLHRFADKDPFERLRPVDGEVDWPLQWLPRDLVEDPDDRAEEELDLGTLLAQGAGTAFYEYDFGDSWLLRMQLLGSRPAAAGGPPACVVDGARRGPLEDSGGVPGYEELLAVLADPDDPEHAESREWVAEMTGTDEPYDPEEFDIEDLNHRLASALEERSPRG
uniref:plasmid pRiA4b ORF-3 family protein n=1 Tax=Pigmentiphaga litoralis TaxID=516702 RepID=UPI00389AA596